MRGYDRESLDITDDEFAENLRLFVEAIEAHRKEEGETETPLYLECLRDALEKWDNRPRVLH
jgi:hypothetical protein